MNRLPKAKTENFVVQDLNDGILIYNLANNKAFSLNQTSAIIYQSCDGKTTIEELKTKSGFTEDLVHLTLAELNKMGFVEMPSDYVSSLDGMSRREAVKKVGLATMIALPIITSVTAPSAANAASNVTCRPATPWANCTFDQFKQAECCDGLRCLGDRWCRNCLTTGNWFMLSGTPLDVTTCNNYPEKNQCCNNTSDAVVGTSGGNYFCYCP